MSVRRSSAARQRARRALLDEKVAVAASRLRRAKMWGGDVAAAEARVARARLIAAAPDLLAALIAMHAFHVAAPSWAKGQPSPSLSSAVDLMARAAIGKAEGRLFTRPSP